MFRFARYAGASVLLLGLVGCNASVEEKKAAKEAPKLDAKKQEEMQMEMYKKGGGTPGATGSREGPPPSVPGEKK